MQAAQAQTGKEQPHAGPRAAAKAAALQAAAQALPSREQQERELRHRQALLHFQQHRQQPPPAPAPARHTLSPPGAAPRIDLAPSRGTALGAAPTAHLSPREAGPAPPLARASRMAQTPAPHAAGYQQRALLSPRAQQAPPPQQRGAPPSPAPLSPRAGDPHPFGAAAAPAPSVPTPPPALPC